MGVTAPDGGGLTGPVDPAPLGALAVRTLAAVGAGAVMLAAHVNLPLLLLVVVCVLAVDARNVFSLRNFFLAYTAVVFGVGGGVLHLTDQPIYGDIVGYVLVFLAGYAVASMPARTSRSVDQRTLRRSTAPAGKGPLSLFVLEHALVTLIALNLLFLAFQFLKYGVAGYYQGQGLLNEALTYGQASTSGGAEQIVRFALTDGGIGLVILYVRACFELSRPIRYRYPVALLVALPVLSLSRFDAVVGAMTMLAVYACDGRLTAIGRAPRTSSVPTRPFSHPRPVPAESAGRHLNRAALVILGLVLAVAMSAFVASIRGGFVNKSGTVGTAPDAVAMFTSELSPVQAYGDIRANIKILGHPYGSTIIWPLLLKVVPRAWYPDKPLNSGAYYMSVVRPAEWAAGYALPPTFFGDAYLSFGYVGALLCCLILGVVSARLDLAYKRRILSRLPMFLLVFANFYALLRDPLSESLAAIILTMLVYGVGNRMFRSREPLVVDSAGDAVSAAAARPDLQVMGGPVPLLRPGPG